LVQNRPVIQERQETSLLEYQVQHTDEPDDILLNLAQLHSAKYLQTFARRDRYPDIPEEVMINMAVANHKALVEGAMLDKSAPAQSNADSYGDATPGPSAPTRSRKRIRSGISGRASKRARGSSHAQPESTRLSHFLSLHPGGQSSEFFISDYHHRTERPQTPASDEDDAPTLVITTNPSGSSSDGIFYHVNSLN
jgi:hypothetical protein